MLSDEERSRIRIEEVFRDEVRKSLQPRQGVGAKVFHFLDSSLGIFLLSSVLLTGLSSWYLSRSEQIRTAAANYESLREIGAELRFRIDILKLLDQAEVSYSELHTARAALTGTTINDAKVGQLGTFEPMFPQFRDRSLFFHMADGDNPSQRSVKWSRCGSCAQFSKSRQ